MRILCLNYLALYAFHKSIERHGAKVTFAVLAYGNDVILSLLLPNHQQVWNFTHLRVADFAADTLVAAEGFGEPRGSGNRFTPYRDGTDGFFVARLSCI